MPWLGKYIKYLSSGQKKTPANAQPKSLNGGMCKKSSNCASLVRAGRLDSFLVEMLVGTGCDQTMVSLELVDPAEVDRTKKAQVLCVESHIEFYPTAMVKLSVGGQEQEKEVYSCSSKMPTSVLLQRDAIGQDSLLLNNAFAVVTRSLTQKAVVEGPDVPMENLPKDMLVQGQAAADVFPTVTQCEDGRVAVQKPRG